MLDHRPMFGALSLCALLLVGCDESPAAVRCGAGTVEEDGLCEAVSRDAEVRGDDGGALACGPGTVEKNGVCEIITADGGAQSEQDLDAADQAGAGTEDSTPIPAGALQNSIDAIWADSFDPNLGDPAHISQTFPLFAAVPRAFPLDGSFPKTNAWYEIIEGGDGSDCSHSTNTATNTVVELGRIAAWIYYEDGGWEQFANTVAHGLAQPGGGGGTKQPNVGDYFVGDIEGIRNYYGCPNTAGALRLSHLDASVVAGTTATGHGLYKPVFGWIYHGWAPPQVVIDYGRRPTAVLVTLWARLVVEDPALPDDRANADYVIHVGSDKKEANGHTIQGDIGISRWKRVTAEWRPFNFLTGGWTKAEFTKTAPPTATVPE